MPKDLLFDLNPTQQEAVKATEGPILILAGAGSGKTRVLTYKVAYLIGEKKVNPSNILTVTFTNKAAGEMKERIIKLIGQTSTQPLMGTFHSICAKILRKEGHNIGLAPGFSIYDEVDALTVVKEAMAKLNISIKQVNPGAIRNIISSAKNEVISELEYPQYARGFFQETAARVYIEYQKILKENQALDFDDLLMHTIQLFQVIPKILTRYQIQFQYILVDEYQDTNAAQYQLIKLLASRHRNLCVVGDASQAIYGFRGADFRNIVNFKNDYPEAKVFNLEQNYRSTQVILDAAQAVISENRTHPILKLWTDKKEGAKISIFQARSEVEEALFLLDQINSLIKEDKSLNLNSFAILYRTNAQSRSIEEVFLKAGLPYRLVGGVQFYERREIKDVLSYLRLVANPKDSVSKKRVEKIGKGRAQKFYELFKDIEQYKTLELMDQILEKIGYLEYLDDGTEQGKARVENVKELRSVAEEFPDLDQFLENVALIQDNQMPDSKLESNQKEAVTLMTIHAAKGLEFPVVFIVGMEEGLFPHSRSMLDPNQMEEERRLAYVGITRAKFKLFLTHARTRLYFGSRSNNLVSRFLSSIPEHLLDQKYSSKLIDPDERLSHLEDFQDDVSKVDEDDWLNF
ncbi:UvrD-helicase domain-containing protein [Candidatus Daviesbacteria bacterium]|nr:UvrD-helicase domain-containing protein [Candidatus Daviesbacteria bacterium]